MTALAFILGVLPLAYATGSGAASRRVLGTTVLGGMLAATIIADLRRARPRSTSASASSQAATLPLPGGRRAGRGGGLS
jgi:hypothetical protein